MPSILSETKNTKVYATHKSTADKYGCNGVYLVYFIQIQKAL